MAPKIIRGMRSTHGDHYQLNTTTLIRHAARTFPEQEIVYRTPHGGWSRYTYGDAYRRVQRAANVLESLGVGPGDVVGVLDWNSRRHFELYWAIPGLAAVMLQMNLRLMPNELGYVIRHSGATVVLVDESLLPVAEALAPYAQNIRIWVVMSDRPMAEIATALPGVVHFEDLLAAASDRYDWPVIDETSAYSACYTSGTTGRPKGVYYSHRGICLHSYSEALAYGATNDDAIMLIPPMFHAQCWGFPQMAALVSAKVILPGRYTAADTSVLVDEMVAEQVTLANGAPAIYQPMLDYIATLDEKPNLGRTRLICGATEPTLALMRGFRDLTGATVIHTYGATEAGPLATVNRLKPALRSVLTEDEQWNLRRCQGLPLPGVDIRIADTNGKALPWDGVAQGEIQLRAPWVIESYYHLEDNEERFADGWWKSGDVGRIDQYGYLRVTDRIKDVIKSGGEWISSIDMEMLLMAHPNIAEVAVVAAPHSKWQERPVAVIVTLNGEDVPLADIRRFLGGHFANWQLPDAVIQVRELPRTSVGKIDKKTLRSEYANIYAQRVDIP